jgi:hypothetical protein
MLNNNSLSRNHAITGNTVTEIAFLQELSKNEKLKTGGGLRSRKAPCGKVVFSSNMQH